MGWAFNTPSDTSTWGPQIVAIAAVFTGFSLLIVSLRLYVRAHLINAVGPDDWAILFGWFGICGYSTCTIVQTKWGLGINNIDAMPTENIETFLIIQYVGSPLYVCCLYGFKFSLLLSYLRFIPTGPWRLVTIGMAVVVTMAHIAFALCFLFGCVPIAKFWDTSITWGTCLGLPFYTAFSALTITFDILIMLLPFPTLLKTRIQTRKKIVLCGLFTLGVFITAVQIVRFSYLSQLVNLLDSANPIVWSIVEGNLGIITTSIPTLAPLLRYYSEKSRTGGYSGDARSGKSAPAGNRSSTYELNSFHRGLRGHGPAVERNVVITGNHSDDSTERIYDPSQAGIMKRTDVLVSSTDGQTSERSVRVDENTS